MQKTNVLFAILVLLMSLLPCADALTGDDCEEHTHISQNTDDQHSESDTCTPFCSCACCRLSVQGNDIIIPHNQRDDMNYHDLWNPGQLSPPSFSIWQPPRV